MSFTVLHVCTGNICRSPMAEHLMRAGLADRLGAAADGFVVGSAGTWGHSGAPMDPRALATLEATGVDGGSFRARELEADLVQGADLVLAATREHRAAAVVLHPPAARWTFTVRELARLAAAVDPHALPEAGPVERARALVPLIAAQRGQVPVVRPRDDDLADPYTAPASAFTACAQLLVAALSVPLDLLVPSAAG